MEDAREISRARNMNIHLSKPGGRMEGPFTVEQINRDIASRKYKDNDYWAWHEGLPEWVPLHSIPGVTGKGASADGAGETQIIERPQPSAASSISRTTQEKSPPSLQQQLSSGMPFSALERIVVLTTGEGPAASQALATLGMLEAVTGEALATIRQQVPRDVITQCNFLEKLRNGGPIPDVAWRAVANVNAELVSQAREGIFRICARTFPIDTGDLVALFLFYNKQRL